MAADDEDEIKYVAVFSGYEYYLSSYNDLVMLNVVIANVVNIQPY